MRPFLIALGACVVLAGLTYALAIRPLAAQQDALEAETADLRTQEGQLRQQLTQLQSIQQDELSIRARLNRQQALIPMGDPAQPSFVRQIQLAADDSGVDIQSLVFGQPAAVDDAVAQGPDNLLLTAIPVTMTVNGGYFQAVDFFRRLEVEVERGVAVDAVTMIEGEDGFPLLAASVNGRLFAQLPSFVAPAPEPTPTETPAEDDQ